MSTFKTKTNAAQITAKLLSTSALTTALLALAMNPARAQDVTVPDVTIPEAPSIETPAAPEAPAVNEGQSWTGFTDEEGSITVETPTTTFTDITQNTQLYVGTSANLDIPEGHHVNINQASSNYLFVAKAAPDADPTFILGRLTADGRVIIIDRNGVFTGADSVIDVAGIVMTTGDINIEDLRANEFGNYEISNITEGAINLNGSISVADAGLAAFVAPSVSNAGVINATMGKVALASGETVTLDLYGDDLVEVAVPGNVADALVENSGSINANGGVVQISAAQAKDVVDNIINVSGIVDVSSVSTQGGKIVLSGGDAGKVKVTGILDASGATGGDIEVTGQFVSAEDNAVLDASGTNGGGTIHFGGDWQGQGDTPTSEYAFVGQDAILNANAEEDGDGGEVVVWSDKVTGFFGLITAQGGANSGNGGQVETSSKGNLQAYGNVDASAANGLGGEWLLDPDNLTVIAGAPGLVDATNAANVITASGNATASTVTNQTIQNALNGGSSVTLRTHDNNNAEQGDITVNATITKSAGGNATLRMESHDDVVINQAITSTAGQLNVLLLAGFDDTNNPDSGNNDVSINALINTNGGYLEAGADHDINGNGTIQTEGGRVYFVAGNGFNLPIANYTPDNSMTDTSILYSGSIDTDGGQVYMNAGDDIRINGAITTDGGAATFIARGTNTDLGDVEFQTNGSVNTTRTTGAEGNVFISAEEVKLNSTGNAIIAAEGVAGDDGTVTIERSTEGGLFVGSAAIDPAVAPHMELLTSEIGKITARELILGGANVNGISVGSLNTQANISGAVTFTAGGNGTLGVLDVNNNNVYFSGSQFFNGVNVNANDSVLIDGTLTSNGAVVLNADTNNEGVGLLQISTGDSIVTSDDNVTYTGNEVALNGTGFINAAGGDITLNNRSIFQGGANSLQTSGNGIISLTVWDANIGATVGSIQNAIDALQNTNTALNSNVLTLKKHAGSTGGGVTAGDGTFNENVTINQANVKIDGFDSVPGGTPEITVKGNGASPVFTVSAINFNLDPIIVDAFGADYGVVVNAGAFNGFSSIGNTYVNSDIAGIKITGNAVGTATIQGNTFEGSATRGVEVAGLSGDALLLINSNNMGTVGDSVVNGVWSSGAINNGNIGIGGNTIVASGAGVLISQPVTNGSNVQITASNNITGIDAVEFSGNVDSSTVNISGGNTLIGTGSDSFSDAIDFRGLVINSNVNINNNTLIQGADDGIQVIGGIRGGTFTVSGNSQITGQNGDGVALLSLAGGGGNGNAISDGAEVEILNNTIAGNGPEGDTDNGDGAVSDGVLISGNVVGAPGPDTILEVSGNTITGYNNGVHLFGDVSEAVVQVNVNDSISAGNHGVFFEGDILSNSLITVNGNEEINSTFGDGVHFSGSIGGGSFIQVSDNNDGIFAANHGIYFGGPVNGATLNIHDNIIAANQDNGFIGSGIYFASTINNATINIGDGERDSNPSNFIVVGPQGDGDTDGIHFAGVVGQGAKVKIDGNRIGYNGDGTVNAINGDGIEFAADVNGNADIDVIDNRVRAKGNASGTGDGVKFSGHIGGTANVAVGVSPSDGNNIDVTGNGVEFNGITGGTVSVASNTIVADENGVEFGAGSPSIEGGADVFVLSNTINATLDGIYVDDDITGAGTTFTAKNNTITAGDDGVDIDNVRNGAVVSIGGAGSSDGNRITADGNGIEFDAGIDATVLIQKNRISAGADGVNVRDDDDGHTTAIDTGANVKILDNKIGSEDSDSIGGHGINVEESVTGGSYLEIARNDIGSFSNPVNLDGIHFGGPVTGGSTVYIHNNNHGIHADDHGIYFGGAINGGATVDIDDNIIGANEDGGVIGSGIFFDGTINAATINIGDGTDSPTNGGASNIIRVGDPDGHAGYDVSNLDGIHFNKEVGSDADINIDGNRLGYNADFVGGALDNERLPGDGIEFHGPVTGNADISITDNHIRADQDGIRFAGIIKDFAKILIGGSGDRNVIDANDNGIEFEDIITGESLITISYNEVDADNDGILFGDDVNNADLPVGTSEQEIYIANNDIYGGNNGIHFAGEVFGPYHDTLIEANKIKGENGQGIVFDGDIDQARVRIINGNDIEGQVDGVRFLGEVEDGAVVNIDDNTTIVGVDEEAVHFFEEIEESTVTIVGNDNLTGGDHGIEFDGEIDESDVTISGNNHGIHADNHGIVFFGDVEDDSTINIHDNIIAANEDGGSTGDGIHFGGKIIDSEVNIGDGAGPDYYDNPSNFIKGVDGIHFVGDIEDGSNIKIDGNRLGYYKTSGGSHQFAELKDDGIEFDGAIEDVSTILITENKILSDDDGIKFNGKITDDARVTIGGDYGKGNIIDADGDGIQFGADIEKHSLLEISHNNIDAQENGIEFNGKTSNHIHGGHDEEILIKKNSIEAQENGIIFFGKAEGELHDIVIRDNYKVHGHDGHGIAHVGSIDDAEVWILDNDDVFGDDDGIHVVGQFYNDAKIKIAGNTVDSGDDDGIHVEDTGNDWGVDLDIVNNHVHNTGDDGIFVKNIEDALIGWNTVHNTDGNGIYGSNIDYSEILGNDIWDTDENGILVNPTDNIDIAYNDIYDAGWDGIHVDNGNYAQIWKNDIKKTGDDGIDVNDNDHVEIWSNDIRDTNGNGIEVSDSYRAKIKYNDVSYTDGDGINVYNSDKAEVSKNDVYRAKGDGIKVDKSDYVEINFNDVWKSGRDGIDLSRSHGSEIKGNDVFFSGDNGIEVTDSSWINIKWNDSHHNGGAGIFVDPSWFINVAHNDLSWNTYGVRFEDVYFSTIEDNDIDHNLIGIKLIDSHGINVEGNAISENFWYGLWAYGGDNGYIKVHNNVFLDNPTHAFFQSGIIDLTGLDEGKAWSNEFHGGNVALEFDAWNNKPWLLSLVKEEGGFTYDYLWPFLSGWNFYSNDSYTFDTFNGSTVYPPSNFGGTIGAQLFDGQEDYFVKLGSKTFVVPGPIEIVDEGPVDEVYVLSRVSLIQKDDYYSEPTWLAIWLDAQDSTYVMDGVPFSPAAQGGVVTPEQLAFLEEKFKHWPDVNNRGIFFFGALPAPEGVEFLKDPIFDPFNGGVSGLNVTITGLPRVSGFAPASGGAAGLNAIAPAAGDETTSADLANIEPAAGGEGGQNVSCWSDAVNAAGTGGPVNYSYGGTFEESIAAAATCGAQSF